MKSKIYSRKVAKDAKFGICFLPLRLRAFAGNIQNLLVAALLARLVNQNALLCALCVSAVTSLKKKGE